MLSRLCVTDCSLIYSFVLDTVTGARELSESCVSQKSGSLETVQPCVLSQVGGSGVSPREIFATYVWANLHSEPFRGQNDLKKIHAVVDMCLVKI